MVDVIKAIDGLDYVRRGVKVSDCWHLLFKARRQLEAVFDQSVYRPYLRISRQTAHELHKSITEIMHEHDIDSNYVLTESDAWPILDYKTKFTSIFIAEIAALPAYLVIPKESYNVDSLIESGELLFPPDMLEKAPETIDDAREVGRCLAYERHTACGFHTFRVVEAVARRYWDHESSNKKRPHPDTIGNIAGQLEMNNFGDDKVIEALKQMSKLHRNPLAHPEVILTDDEAGAAIGMARSVITAMLVNLPDVPPTTGAPSIS